MTSHLRVTIDDIDLVLTEDTSISIELKNPYLNDGIDTYTYSFDVPLDGNRELLGDLDNPDSDRRLTSIEGHPMAIYIDGVLFAHGKVATIEEQTIVDKVSISMTSNKKQIKELVGNIGLRDLSFDKMPLEERKIGEMIGDITVDGDSTSTYTSVLPVYANDIDGENDPILDMAKVVNFTSKSTFGASSYSKIQVNALGFSAPKEFATTPGSNLQASMADGKAVVKYDYINTQYAYGDSVPQAGNRRAIYHNARISYTHHRIDKDGKSTDEVLNNGTYGPYYVLDADRPQSGICFYVMYVIEALFRELNIIYSDTVLRQVEDMRHLSFYTTRCKYDLLPRFYHFKETSLTGEDTYDFGWSNDFDKNGVNKWLEDRGIKGKLEFGYKNQEDVDIRSTAVDVRVYNHLYITHSDHSADSDYELLKSSIPEEGDGKDPIYLYGRISESTVMRVTDFDYIDIRITNEIDGITSTHTYTRGKLQNKYGDNTYKFAANVMAMYANSQNLPEMSVTSFLDSLWGSFGLRFYYDTESNIVEPYFIRDILRNNTVHQIGGQDISVRKVVEKITGVTMKYSAEKERKEQVSDVYKGVTDYDTDYDYLVDKTPSGRIITKRTYSEFPKGGLSTSDTNLYVDLNTGNLFRVKIDKEALGEGRIQQLKPVRFQVAQYKGFTEMADEYKSYDEDALIEDSDVKGSIQEIVSDFEPLKQNDLRGKLPDNTALLAPFIDADMWNENAEMDHLSTVVGSNQVYVHYIDQIFSTEERYDVKGSDDGVSPLQEYDWGNRITLMRGGGTNATRQHFDFDYDHFKNEKWRMVSGEYCMDSDNISLYGEEYDYNGDAPGIGSGMVNGTYNGTYTRDEAKSYLTDIFSYSNADILSPFRVVPGSKMQAAGYTDISASDYATYYDGVRGLKESNGDIHHFIFVRITDYGEVYTESQIMDYLSSLEKAAYRTGRSIMDIDRETSQDMIIGMGGGGRRMLVAWYDNEKEANYYSILLHELGAIYYGDESSGSVSIADSLVDGFWIEHNSKHENYGRFSMAIRAYHRHPVTGKMMCNPTVAYRGLADTFFSEYIYFLLHRKKLFIETICEIQHIIDMQWKDRYCIAGHTGWIDQVSVKVSVQKGIEKVEFTMFEL